MRHSKYAAISGSFWTFGPISVPMHEKILQNRFKRMKSVEKLVDAENSAESFDLQSVWIWRKK